VSIEPYCQFSSFFVEYLAHIVPFVFCFHFIMSTPISTHPVKNIPDFTSSTPSSSVWDRISTWASEHKAVVYTIAGVAVVVTGAGVAYYLTESVGGMLAFRQR
jgi:hypothetical protein